jgi:ATP-dependent DNA helicase PIF1
MLSMRESKRGPWMKLMANGDLLPAAGPVNGVYTARLEMGPNNMIPDWTTLANIFAATFSYQFNSQLRQRGNKHTIHAINGGNMPDRFNVTRFRIFFSFKVSRRNQRKKGENRQDDEARAEWRLLDCYATTRRVQGGTHGTYKRVINAEQLMQSMLAGLSTMGGNDNEEYQQDWTIHRFQAKVFDMYVDDQVGGCSWRSGDTSIMINDVMYFSPRARSKNDCFIRCLMLLIHRGEVQLPTEKKSIKAVTELIYSTLGWVRGTLISVQQVLDFARVFKVSMRIYDPSKIDNEGILSLHDDALLGKWLQTDGVAGRLFLYKNHYMIFDESKFGEAPKCDNCGNKKIHGLKHRCQSMFINADQDAKDMSACTIPDLNAESRRLNIMKTVYQGDVNEQDAKIQTMYTKFLDQGQAVLLIGAGGTGKTTVVQDLCRNKIADKKKLIIAHDAVAVANFLSLQDKNTKVGTIHKIFGIPIYASIETWLDQLLDEGCSRDLQQQRKRSKTGLHNKKRQSPPTPRERLFYKLSKIEYLFIDEINSITPSLFEVISRIFKMVKGSDNPFGGVNLMLTGDFLQRVPITQSSSNRYIFLSSTFQSINFHVCYLNVVRRITNLDDNLEKWFLQLQLRMAQGVATKEDIDTLNMCIADDAYIYDPETVILCSTNKQVYDHGSKMIKKLFSNVEGKVYEAENWPTEQKTSLSMSTKCCSSFTAYIGMRVMLSNNKWLQTDGVGNGSLGTIVGYDDNGVDVHFDSSSSIKKITPISINNSKVVQLPIVQGYSFTMSKCQGMSLNKVCIMTDSSDVREFGCGEMYVAVSRARSWSNFKVVGEIKATDIRVSSVNLRLNDILSHDKFPTNKQFHELSDKVSNSSSKQNFNGDNRCPVMSQKSRKGAKEGVPLQLFNPVFDFSEEGGKFTAKDGDLLKYLPEHEVQSGTGRKKPHCTFRNTVFYDLETWNNISTNYVHKVYFVGASYWKDNKLIERKSICTKNGGHDEVFDKFSEWIFAKLKSLNKKLKQLKGRYRNVFKSVEPITVIAYNGSGYDNHFVSQKLWNSKYFNRNFIITHTVRQSKLIKIDIRSRHTPWKVLMTFWDPCLLLNQSLKKAVKSYCPSLKQGKDVFPHGYVSRVGPVAAIGDDELKEVNIETDFCSDEDRAEIRKRIKSGELQAGPSPDTVMMPLRKQLFFYGELDVKVLERLVIALDYLCFNHLLPTVSILKFSTIAQMTKYGWLSNLDKEFIYKPQKARGGEKEYSDETLYTKMHLLSQRLDGEIRKSVYGGRCYPRIKRWISSQLEELKKKLQNIETIERREQRSLLKERKALYHSIDDAYVYADVHSMYVSIMKNRDFPYGPHVERAGVDAQRYFEDWLRKITLLHRSGVDIRKTDLPMFVAKLDVITNKSEVEPPLAQKGRGNKNKDGLFWSNDDKIQQNYNSVDLILALRNGCELRNCSWIISWDKKGKLFENWMKTTLALRARGGAFDEQGKLLGNTSYGVSLKRNYDTQYLTVTSQKDLNDVINDATKIVEKCVIQGESECIHFTLSSLKDSNDDYSSSCPQVGTFVLGYSHELLDSFYDEINPERRNPDPSISLRTQVAYSDTDSLFFPFHAMQENPRLLAMCGDDEGLLGDDLVSKWRKRGVKLPNGKKWKSLSNGGEPCTKCVDLKKKYGIQYCMHELEFCKILDLIAPSPKVYALLYMDPNGYLHDNTIKHKGIAIKNMKLTDPSIEKAAVEGQYRDSLKIDHFRDDKALKVHRTQFAKTMFYPNAQEKKQGLKALDVLTKNLGREIFKNKWVKRVEVGELFPKLAKEFEHYSLPLGYVKK